VLIALGVVATTCVALVIGLLTHSFLAALLTAFVEGVGLLIVGGGIVAFALRKRAR
jgi:undecaprenyl pyrophosphate phosphatase UppP